MTIKPITRPVPPKMKGRKIIKVGALTYAQLIKFMLEGVYTCEELSEMTGLHKVTVYQYARELHAAKAAHITHFEPDARGRHNIKVYKIGRGKDAVRPKATQVERQARYRAKIAAQQMQQVLAGKAEYVPRANGRKLFRLLDAHA